MSKIKILVDSASDITHEMAETHCIGVVPLTITFGLKQFKDFYELNSQKFYKMMKSSPVLPKTSQPNPEEIVSEIKKYEQDYDEVILVTLSSNGSGTYSSAVAAKKAMDEAKTPLKIHIFDSLNTSLAHASMAIKASCMAQLGETAESIIKRLETMREKMGSYFVVDTFEYLKKGGRVNTVTSIIGGLFDIKPIITIVEGWGRNFGNARGFKQAKSKLCELFVNKAESFEEIFVSHADCIDKAKELTDMLKEKVGDIKIHLAEMGSVMGTHAGPGSVAIFFEEKSPHTLRG